MFSWLKHQWGVWVAAHGADFEADISYLDFEFASQKPPAFLTIDDRAICFMGDWTALDPAQLTQFMPWNAFDATVDDQFVKDWDRMVSEVSVFASKYNMRKPDMIFHPEWLQKMREISQTQIMSVLVYMGVRVQFAELEQVTALRRL